MVNTTTNSSVFIRANEISEVMEISLAYAYRIIKQLNKELAANGALVVQGRTNRSYFYKRLYGKG